ncbi:PhzA/PhzB family protein [Pseudomonas sp. GNP013]
MQKTPHTQDFANHLELRRINRATVERYMHMKGAERLQRHTLFSEDGCGGTWMTETGLPVVFQGHQSLARLSEWVEQCFPDWEWYNVKIFETDDPNHIRVECEGRGKVLIPGHLQFYRDSHYIHSFELDNGRIRRNRELINPVHRPHTLDTLSQDRRREQDL